ncbi:MAG: beta-galactosidase [Lachnospiraceae bacterium]
MCHDLMRSLKRKPFFQMESCPSATNWQGVSKLKKPGVLFAQSMVRSRMAVRAHCISRSPSKPGRIGSSSDGAVIDHYGENDTRVFREVCRGRRDAEGDLGAGRQRGEEPGGDDLRLGQPVGNGGQQGAA